MIGRAGGGKDIADNNKIDYRIEDASDADIRLYETALRNNLGGSYDFINNIITFYNGALQRKGLKLKYDLSRTEFIDKISIINDLVIWHHEHAHFFQSLGTTNGIYLVDLYIKNMVRLFTAASKTKFSLPIKKYIKKIICTNKLNSAEKSSMLLSLVYMSMLDYNLGSQAIVVLDKPQDPMNIFDTKYIRFYLANDAYDEALGVSPKYIPSVRLYDLKTGKAHLCFLGSYILMEAFAHSVQMEHLIWFNDSCAQEYFYQYVNDFDNLIYTLPYIIAHHMVPREYMDRTKYSFATMRVIIDISLMYNDHVINSAHNSKHDDAYYLSATSQPGHTFLNILKILYKIRPMENTDNDLLRFYDDICNELKIPTQAEMVAYTKKYIENIDSHFSSSTMVYYYKYFLTGMKERENNPKFFINNMINCDEMTKYLDVFEDCIAYINPDGSIINTKGLQPAINMFMTSSVYLQMINCNEILCPFKQRYSTCLHGQYDCEDMFHPDRPFSAKHDCYYINAINQIKYGGNC